MFIQKNHTKVKLKAGQPAYGVISSWSKQSPKNPSISSLQRH
jgi:hypothetical protein